jgi:hypothetical protein
MDRQWQWSVVIMFVKVKFSRYRPSVAQRVGRGIAVLFYDRDTRRGWVVSNTPQPHFTSGKDPVPILQEAGWAPGPVWTGGKSRPHRDSFPDRPVRSQSLYRLSYAAHLLCMYICIYVCVCVCVCMCVCNIRSCDWRGILWYCYYHNGVCRGAVAVYCNKVWARK